MFVRTLDLFYPSSLPSLSHDKEDQTFVDICKFDS